MKISMILNVALGIALVFLCYLVTIGKGKEKEQEQEQEQTWIRVDWHLSVKGAL